MVVLQYLLSKFSKKKQCVAIYFLPLLQCKTNTFALELLTEMKPYAVLNVHTCMEKVNRDVLVVPCF